MRSILLLLSFFLIGAHTNLLAGTLTIRDAVQRGLTVHPKVQIAEAMLHAAKGERLATLSPPSSVIATEYEGIPRSERSIAQYGERKVSVTQELIFPLKYVWLTSATNSKVKAARQQAMSNLLDLESEIRKTYSDAWTLSEKVAILTGNVEAAKEYAALLERKFALGETASLEARRARVEYLQSKSLLETTHREYSTAHMRLCRMLAIDTTALTLQSPFDATTFSELSLSDTSITSNPDLKTAEFESRQANSERTLANIGWLPDWELSYFQQKMPAELNPDYWGVGFGFSLPLWYWLGGRGAIQTADAHRKAQSAEWSSLRNETASERDRLLQTIASLRERHRLYQMEIVPAAKDAYDLAMKSYRLGEANYLQVIDAQKSSLATQLELIEIEREHYQNLTDLDRLFGVSIVGARESYTRLEKGN